MNSFSRPTRSIKLDAIRLALTKLPPNRSFGAEELKKSQYYVARLRDDTQDKPLDIIIEKIAGSEIIGRENGMPGQEFRKSIVVEIKNLEKYNLEIHNFYYGLALHYKNPELFLRSTRHFEPFIIWLREKVNVWLGVRKIRFSKDRIELLKKITPS